jgi:hypothetical protein
MQIIDFMLWLHFYFSFPKYVQPKPRADPELNTHRTTLRLLATQSFSTASVLYFEVSTTYLPAILPSCISSYTLFSSLKPQLLYGACWIELVIRIDFYEGTKLTLIRPRLKNSMASAESRLLPTYEPLIVIILMTDSKTGARR